MVLQLLLLLTAFHQDDPAKPTEVAPVVVVAERGRALAELRRCLARGCPPVEDMTLSLQAADLEFEAGAYAAAQRLLDATLERNRANVAQAPVLHAGLQRANARILMHLGDKAKAIYAAAQIPAAMREGFATDSPRVLEARLEFADILGKLGEVERARRSYAALRSDALRAGVRSIVEMVDLRRALLLTATQGRWSSATALRRMSDDAGLLPMTRLAAAVLAVREGGGDEDALRRLSQLSVALQAGAVGPPLLYSPAIPVADWRQPQAVESRVGTRDMRVIASGTDWADVGFWITPEGRVEDAAVLRSRAARTWQEQVLRAVRQRRYGPREGDAAERLLRIERYTLVHYWNPEPAGGSHIRTRSSLATLETLDMTRPPPAP